jgi:hypothetical protein
VAPNKVVVLPISIGNETSDVVDAIAANFMDSDISTRVDKSSASLGRRYSRADEIGAPFAVTVDFDTLKDNTATLIDRDTCIQLRVLKDYVTPLLLYFVHGRMNWEKASSKYPIVQVDQDGDGSKKADDLNAKTVMEVNSRGRLSRPDQPYVFSILTDQLYRTTWSYCFCVAYIFCHGLFSCPMICFSIHRSCA